MEKEDKEKTDEEFFIGETVLVTSGKKKVKKLEEEVFEKNIFDEEVFERDDDISDDFGFLFVEEDEKKYEEREREEKSDEDFVENNFDFYDSKNDSYNVENIDTKERKENVFSSIEDIREKEKKDREKQNEMVGFSVNYSTGEEKRDFDYTSI